MELEHTIDLATGQESDRPLSGQALGIRDGLRELEQARLDYQQCQSEALSRLHTYAIYHPQTEFGRVLADLLTVMGMEGPS